MWSEVGDRVIESPDFIKAAKEKIAEVRENLRIAQSRQKSYADKRRQKLKFDVGDHVYLKVSPIRGTRRFRMREKLAPRYIGLYPIIKRIGAVAYKIKLPKQLSDVHNVFHVSQLQKCLRVPEDQVVPNTLDLQDDPLQLPLSLPFSRVLATISASRSSLSPRNLFMASCKSREERLVLLAKSHLGQRAMAT
jgi:hypothetical protein